MKAVLVGDAVRRGLCLLTCAGCCVGCSNSTTSPDRAFESPPIDRLFIFVRDWPTEDVTLALVRTAHESTVTLFRDATLEGRPRTVLDSIGPFRNDPQKLREMLNTFDVWALNAPNAPGAACRTMNGQRQCAIAFNDYSLVMRVESGGEVRVQRYTGLEKTTANRSARALADYVLAWARDLERRGQRP